MQERRNLERRDLIYYLRVLDRSSNQFLGYAANISAGGVMLIGKQPINSDTPFHLRMLLPAKVGGKENLDFDAVSRWCRQNGDPNYFNSGFEVSRIAAENLSIIERLCSLSPLQRRRKLTAKRAFDVLASLFGLFFLLPVFIAVGFALRLEASGSIFFIAKRVGKFGRPFGMYKFRTMIEAQGNNGPRITAHDDPRVTRVGHFLRKTKFNELPQLYNVLKGEMSFVGPRPEYLEFVEHYSPEHREVLSVTPGITSLAAIFYVDEERMLRFSDVAETYLQNILPDKLRLDLLYVRSRSLLLDLDILIQTMMVLIPRFRGAAPHVESIIRGPFRRARQYLPWFAIDALIAFVSLFLAGALLRSTGSPDADMGQFLNAAVLMIAVFSATNWLTGVQRIQWRYANPTEAIYVIVSASAATILMLLANGIMPLRFPMEILIMAGFFAMGGFLIARYHRPLYKGLNTSIEKLHSASTAGRERVLVVGAGDAGQQIILRFRNNPAGRAFHVVGVVDDDINLLGTLVHRVEVLGGCDRIPELARAMDVGTILFAIHSIEDDRRDTLLRCCRETGARIFVVPDLLKSLRQSMHRREGSLAEPMWVFNGSRLASALDIKNAELFREIHMLAEQARNGDIEGAASGLDQLDTTLEAAASVDVEKPSKQFEA